MATVLIVDDQRFARNYLGALLQNAGYAVLEAQDGMGALEVARKSRPDLVITDLVMPAMDGYEFARELRRDAVLASVPVIFLTAEYVEAEARTLGRRLDVSEFLIKPAEPQKLLKAIETALSGGVSSVPQRSALDAEAQDQHIRLLTRKLYEKVLALEQEVESRKQVENELRAANVQLQMRVSHDALTSLSSRTQWEDFLMREISRAKRSGQRVAVMMIDVDNFKRFNDEFGHMAGDEVLKAVARRLKSQVRAEDSLCRYGGDEFALLLANADAVLLQRRAEALRESVEGLSIDYDDSRIDDIRISIGVAVSPDDGDQVPLLVKAADAALYDAKRLGRNRVRFADKAETRASQG